LAEVQGELGLARQDPVGPSEVVAVGQVAQHHGNILVRGAAAVEPRLPVAVVAAAAVGQLAHWLVRLFALLHQASSRQPDLPP